MLTSADAVSQIFEVIKGGGSGFNWSTLKTYFNGSLPAMPFVIQFPNAVFTIQDVHSFSTDSTTGELKGLELYGSLSIFNGGQAYLQGSHGNNEKYRVDMALMIKMGSAYTSDSPFSFGQAYSNQYVVTKLPNAG